MDDTKRQDLAQALLLKAHELLVTADALGFVLTIETVPQQPLAMGNYHMMSSVREKRVIYNGGIS